VAHGKALPPEVVEQVVAKTDGVPLFVEELTKMVLESGLLQEQEERHALTGPLPPLAIPTTLHDSLMARLDRLASVKALAQLGATLGREFAHDLLQAVAPWDEGTLQRGLQQLIAAEFLYQQGPPPQVTYRFKHALIQEAAYQSLLKSTRQRYHRQIAQVMEARFPDICDTQPELVAHHYTAAGLSIPAIRYWRRAGQRAVQRSAHLEAVAHLRKGLELLATLPETPERAQQELDLQATLGPALMALKGYAAPEVADAYARAHELCEQVGDTPQLCEVLVGLCVFYQERAELRTAHELAQQLLSVAQRLQDPVGLLWAHNVLGYTLRLMGEFVHARTHLEQSLALYNRHTPPTSYSFVFNPGVDSLCGLSETLYVLGYPDQALQRAQEALDLARALSHPFSLAEALSIAARMHRRYGTPHAAQALEDASVALCREQGFAQGLAQGTVLQGWEFAQQGQTEAGIAQMRRGLEALRATGAEVEQPWLLTLLALAYGNVGQPEEGLVLIAEALDIVDKTGKRIDEAGLYRRKGELLLWRERLGHRTTGARQQLAGEAEACFHQALAIARRQQAKTLELRAAISLARLWQQHGKRAEARELLAEIYGWFTQGFDTADLREAKVLLAELS
jgi:predicted ATPase